MMIRELILERIQEILKPELDKFIKLYDFGVDYSKTFSSFKHNIQNKFYRDIERENINDSSDISALASKYAFKYYEQLPEIFLEVGLDKKGNINIQRRGLRDWVEDELSNSKEWMNIVDDNKRSEATKFAHKILFDEYEKITGNDRVLTKDEERSLVALVINKFENEAKEQNFIK